MSGQLVALSILQPWAWCIVHGYKPVENRGRASSYRGELMIHAGKGFDADGWDFIRERFPEIPLPLKDAFARGGIVGSAMMVDCVMQHSSPWFFGRYGYVLKDSTACDLVPCRGQLGFFKPDIEMRPGAAGAAASGDLFSAN